MNGRMSCQQRVSSPGSESKMRVWDPDVTKILGILAHCANLKRARQVTVKRARSLW